MTSNHEHGPEEKAYRAETRDTRPVTDLFSDLVNQMSSLVRTEVSLFRAEMRENMRRAGIGAAEIGAGAMIIQASLIILLIALVHAIDEVTGLGYGWSSLIVGVLFALIGALLLKRGKDNVAQSPIPDRTQRQVEKDVRLVKEEAR
jgi:uncharacterized membrane protein